MKTSHGFILGVIIGAAGFYLYQRYKAQKSG